MSSWTDSYPFRSDYVDAYLKVMGNGKIGIIYIENEKDKEFWVKIIGGDIEKFYEFNPYSIPSNEQINLTRGKKKFLGELGAACEKIIFALDADFDPITINKNEVSKVFYENKYILHTFGYNKESLIFSKENICSALSKYKYFKEHDYSELMERFLIGFSKRIYPMLLRYIYSIDCKAQDGLDDDKFHNLLIPPDIDIIHKAFFDQDWTEFDQFIDEGKSISIGLIEHPCSKPCTQYMNHIQTMGLTENNSYQFINGHHFVQRIINPIIDKITNKIAHSEVAAYQISSNTTEYKKKIGEIKNQLNNEKKFITMINMLDNWENNALFLKAKEKASFINPSSNHS